MPDVVLSGSIRVESPQPPHSGGRNHVRLTTEAFSGSPDQPHPETTNQDAGRAPESMSSSVYDLIVIGSGPAGQRAAIYGAKLGKKVALIEMREVVGGACINTGTIPSKTMREAVLHLSGYNYKSIYGMNYRVKERITMADLAFRVQHVIKTEIDVTEAQLSTQQH